MKDKELLFVKVYPSFGPAYYVGIPEEIDDIDIFLDEHLKNVEFWEVAE